MTPLKESAKQRITKSSYKKRRSKYALSLPWNRQLPKRQLAELTDMDNFVSLNNGCWHVLKECYVFTGKFERPLPFARIQPCGTKCPVCTEEWARFHPAIYCSSNCDFFQSSHCANCFPCNIGSGKKLSQKIKRSPYWIKFFYRSAGGVKVVHVDTLLITLASANIIKLQRVNKSKWWNLSRTSPCHADAGYRRIKIRRDGRVSIFMTRSDGGEETLIYYLTS